MFGLFRRIWSALRSIFRRKEKPEIDLGPGFEFGCGTEYTFDRIKDPEHVEQEPEDPGLVFRKEVKAPVDARIKYREEKYERYEKQVEMYCRKAHTAKHLYMHHHDPKVRKRNGKRLVKEFCRLYAAVHERDLAYAKLQALRDEEKREDKPSGQM